MVVIPGTESRLFPAKLSVKGDCRSVGFGDLEENRAASLCGDRRKQSGGNSAPAESGIHGQIQNLGFVFRALPPGTETGWSVFDQSKEKRKSGIIAKRPLCGFRAAALDAGDSREVAFDRSTDCDRAQFREPGASERPASGCTAELPQIATPVRTSAFRKLLSIA